MLNADYVRSFFPALDSPWAFLDNAGGSLVPQPVLDRLDGYMSRYQHQLGATYPASAQAAEAVAAGRRAAEQLLGSGPNEVVLGHSSTQLAVLLAESMTAGAGAQRPLGPGDEIVVTNLDHEANIGPWRRLAAATGAQIREWRFHPDTLGLEDDGLDAVLTERTRLVAFTHCSNLVGALHDVPALCRKIRDAGALSFVDGVAFAPHRRVEPAALEADMYQVSLYKVYGPHQGALFARPEVLEGLGSVNHGFLEEAPLPYRLEPGGLNHELTASLPGIVEYLTALGQSVAPGGRGPEDLDTLEPGDTGRDLDRAFDAIATREESLVEPLLSYLDNHPKIRLVGPATADRTLRVPTVSFTVEGRDSSEIPPLLEEHQVAVRFGHFYAHRAVRDLGLLDRDGVVRVSLVHYNTQDEVTRLIEGLAEILE